MRMYQLLRDRAASYRADPEVHRGAGAGRCHDARPTPTLGAGETFADLLADRSAFEDYDPDVAGARGYGFVRLHQLALEHLLGAR